MKTTLYILRCDKKWISVTGGPAQLLKFQNLDCLRALGVRSICTAAAFADGKLPKLVDKLIFK